ncbi:MAG: FecR family protein, partial [Candidatus Omnitrophica bacterium]|nr:FecR family protein [Candidatus Omnitrophota bacterium]
MKKELIFLICAVSVLIGGMPAFTLDETVMVSSYAGSVDIVLPGSESPAEKSPGMILAKATNITTGEEAHIDIAFGRAKTNMARIGENSYVVLGPGRGEGLELTSGEVKVVLKDIKKGETFLVRTPSAVCGARGTGWQVKASGDTTAIAVFEGRVFVRGVNGDGSVREEEFWIDEGYRR